MPALLVKSFKPSDLHYKMIGRELWNRLPKKALRYLEPYLTAIPYDRDFKKIENHYLIAFCSLYGIKKDFIQGALFKSSKVDIRRLFIASMVHIYCPHVYYQHPSEINLSKRGFVMGLAKALNQQESNVSVLIREVVAWERDYDEFKEKIHSLVEKIKNLA